MLSGLSCVDVGSRVSGEISMRHRTSSAGRMDRRMPLTGSAKVLFKRSSNWACRKIGKSSGRSSNSTDHIFQPGGATSGYSILVRANSSDSSRRWDS